MVGIKLVTSRPEGMIRQDHTIRKGKECKICKYQSRFIQKMTQVTIGGNKAEPNYSPDMQFP